MIELTWKDIALQPFQMAVVAVSQASKELDAKQIYRAGRICAVARQEAEKIHKARLDMAKKHGFDAETTTFPTPEAEAAYDSEFNTLLTSNKVQIKVQPLDWNQIFGKVKLDGLQLVHLQPVCENVPAEGEI